MAGITVGEGYEAVTVFLLQAPPHAPDRQPFIDFIPREVHSVKEARKLIANLTLATAMIEREMERREKERLVTA